MLTRKTICSSGFSSKSGKLKVSLTESKQLSPEAAIDSTTVTQVAIQFAQVLI